MSVALCKRTASFTFQARDGEANYVVCPIVILPFDANRVKFNRNHPLEGIPMFSISVP